MPQEAKTALCIEIASTRFFGHYNRTRIPVKTNLRYWCVCTTLFGSERIARVSILRSHRSLLWIIFKTEALVHHTRYICICRQTKKKMQSYKTTKKRKIYTRIPQQSRMGRWAGDLIKSFHLQNKARDKHDTSRFIYIQIPRAQKMLKKKRPKRYIHIFGEILHLHSWGCLFKRSYKKS